MTYENGRVIIQIFYFACCSTLNNTVILDGNRSQLFINYLLYQSFINTIKFPSSANMLRLQPTLLIATNYRLKLNNCQLTFAFTNVHCLLDMQHEPILTSIISGNDIVKTNWCNNIPYSHPFPIKHNSWPVSRNGIGIVIVGTGRKNIWLL